MKFKKSKKVMKTKRRKTRKLVRKKNGTKKRVIRGGVSKGLQNKISDYNTKCRRKTWLTGKFVDRGDSECNAWKKSLEEEYKKERPDRIQIEGDYGLDENIEIEGQTTKPTKNKDDMTPRNAITDTEDILADIPDNDDYMSPRNAITDTEDIRADMKFKGM